MSISDEIERLNKLRVDGALSEEEFSSAKRQLIGGDAPPTASEDHSLGRAANRYVSWQMVMSLVALMLFLVIFFTVFLPRFNRDYDGANSPGGNLPPDIRRQLEPTPNR